MGKPTYVFTNRVYPPVTGATGEFLKELAEGLVAEGARVVVVTSRAEEDKRPRDQKTKGPEVANGVEVIRVGTGRFTRASHWRRAWSYLTLYPRLMWQVWKLGKVDAVVTMTDPPLQVAAVTLAALRARKKIHWAQDVYPELAEELGVIPRGGLLARVLRAVSTRALRQQDRIVAVGRCMRDRLVRRGIDAKKIEVIPNWSPVAPVSADAADAMRKKLGWEGKFIALYSGNIGLAHDFETLVEAAKLLEGGSVTMVFAGEGPRLEEVKRATRDLGHVLFLPPQPKEELASFLAAADVHLVSVRAGLEGMVVPSKAYGILAAGRPMIYVGAADAEIALLVRETGAGRVVANDDSATLASLLGKMAETPCSGQAVVAEEFALPKALKRWEKILAS